MRTALRFRRALTGAGFLVTTIGVAVFLWLGVVNGDLASGSDWRGVVGAVAIMGGFFVVGAVLVQHRPSNVIGWLMAGFALSLTVRSALEQHAVWAFLNGAETQARWSVLVVRALEPVVLVAAVTLAVVFPSGVVPGVGWRRALVAIRAIGVGMLLLAPFGSYGGRIATIPSLISAPGLDWVVLFMVLPGFAVLLAALVRIVRVLFTGGDVEREQIKWVAFVLAVTLGLLALAPAMTAAGDIASGFAGIGVPVAIAFGVTRYRLFDIDRLISRTATFTVVVLVLGLLYAMLAIVPFTLVAGFGGGDTPSWVVAASTLAAAALFSPLRRRVQRVVDRRFNRSRYDAERVVERFSSQVREFTDVGSISSGLRGAVQEALQPRGMSLWVQVPW